MATSPYRAFYESILHDARYLALSKEGVIGLVTLRLLLGKSGLDRCGAGRLADVSPLSYEEADIALRELEAAGWIEREGAIVWLIDALANEPNTSVRSASVRKGIVGWVVGTLGADLPIVQRWAERYGLDLREFDEAAPASAEAKVSAGAKMPPKEKAPARGKAAKAKAKGEWSVEALSRLDEMELTRDSLIGLVRCYLYIDGEAPAGYEVGRDVSILKRMSESGAPAALIARAIVGLAWLRDDGLCPELAQPGQGLTLRALWGENNARPDLFAAATRHFPVGLHSRAGRAA